MLLASLRPLCIGITIGICFCGTTSLVIGYSGGLESNFRQLGSTTTRRQTLLIVPPTFPSARFPKPTPKQHRYRQYNLNFNSDGSNDFSTSREELWEIRFQELVKYKREFGHTLVPQNYAANPQLGIWVRTQRYEYRRKQSEVSSQMTKERVNKLNEIGFVWDANPAWEEMIQQLKQHKKEYRTTLVPKRYHANALLGNYWVNGKLQRQEWKRDKLVKEREEKLNETGFVSDALELEASWEEMFQNLLLYQNEHGDTLVPHTYAKFQQLGSWVNSQCREYKRKQSGQESWLTDVRIARLNEIDFVWDAQKAAWQSWVDSQRQQYRRSQSGHESSLTDERGASRDKIGFVWDAKEAAWQSNYNKLCSFYKRYGHTIIPLQGSNALYRWCMHQRYLKCEGRLQDHRYDQLKKICFDFFTRRTAKGASRIECMILYELGRDGHKFDMLNDVFFGVKYNYRPDGVIFVDEAALVIFFEVDEQHHSKYSIIREHRRMQALSKEAETNGYLYEHVTFVRVSTGYRREINCNQSLIQLKFVSKHLHELKSSTQPKPDFSVHYIDYPGDHHHVLASKEHFDEVHILYSQ